MMILQIFKTEGVSVKYKTPKFFIQLKDKNGYCMFTSCMLDSEQEVLEYIEKIKEGLPKARVVQHTIIEEIKL